MAHIYMIQVQGEKLPRYIGATTNLKLRKQHHVRNFRFVCNFLGIEELELEVVPLVEVEDFERHRIEIALIASYQTQGADLANLTPGGPGGPKDPSRETRERMSLAKRGNVNAAGEHQISDENREKMAYWKGKKRPEHSKRMKGRTPSAKTRAKLSRAGRGNTNAQGQIPWNKGNKETN